MAKGKRIKLIVNCLCGMLLLLSISLNLLQILVILPTYSGSYLIETYQYEIEVGSYEQEKKYDVVIDNYWDAYFIGRKEISERFPDGVFANTRFDVRKQTEHRCDVFYDMHSDTWLVYAHAEPLSNKFIIFGGAYGCIISSDGTVIACWGEC